MKTVSLLLTLCLIGCQSQSIPKPTVALQMAPIAINPNARIPAKIAHYMLGAYVDPDNALIRHEAHAIQRVESEAHWDLRPAPLSHREAIKADVQSTHATPTDKPEPISETNVAQVHQVIPTATEQILEKPKRIWAEKLEPAITPNAEGLIDLTIIADDQNADINPFAVRHIDPAAKREVKLQIGGIIHGPISCVLVNGQSMQTGDAVESLTLVRIEAHSALFRYREHLLRLPVAANPTRLLMPR